MVVTATGEGAWVRILATAARWAVAAIARDDQGWQRARVAAAASTAAASNPNHSEINPSATGASSLGGLASYSGGTQQSSRAVRTAHLRARLRDRSAPRPRPPLQTPRRLAGRPRRTAAGPWRAAAWALPTMRPPPGGPPTPASGSAAAAAAAHPPTVCERGHPNSRLNETSVQQQGNKHGVSSGVGWANKR